LKTVTRLISAESENHGWFTRKGGYDSPLVAWMAVVLSMHGEQVVLRMLICRSSASPLGWSCDLSKADLAIGWLCVWSVGDRPLCWGSSVIPEADVL
ncbi:hypothetical protein CRG98_021057, partial [Punica granatum]